MEPLTIQVWSDIACPWCYVGKRRLEAALAAFPEAGNVRVTWRAFQLDPAAPREVPKKPSYAERLARKYGTTLAGAKGMIARMVEAGALDGIEFDFERIRPGNTFDAHRLLHWAAEHHRQGSLKERFLRAYFSEGQAIGSREVVARLVTDVGLDAEAAQAVLASDAYAEEVRAEEHQAHALGITGVPFFAIGRYGVSGAQPPELLERVLNKACGELTPRLERIPDEDGQSCGIESCD